MEAVILLVIVACLIFYFRQKAKKVKTGIKFLNLNQKKILKTKIGFYQKLSNTEQQLFEEKIVAFLNRTQMIAVGCELDDLDKILIATSAIIPIFGFKNWEYKNLTTVYLFPNAFNQQLNYKSQNGQVLGMVGNGTLKNKMVLSKKALHHGFDNKTDKRNTAIHEFVHLIDMLDGDIDGLPKTIIESPHSLPWLDLIHNKIVEIEKNKSDINSYGATSKVEFFAVASEYFFERPKLLERKHPKLYKSLSEFFNQDLA